MIDGSGATRLQLRVDLSRNILPPGLNVSVARLARAGLQQKNIRANVDTLTFKPGGGE